MNMHVLFSIFVLFFLNREVASAPALSQLIVNRVGPCLDRKPTEVVTVSEMSLHKVSSGVALSGQMWIHKHVENGWTIKATMQKCHDIRNLDTCDFYKAAVIIRDGCEESADKSMHRFGHFAKYVTPRLSCPIKPGNYTINKFPFFTSGSVLITAEAKISTSVFGYTYRLEGFNEEDDRLFCVDSSLQMIYIRKHDWIGSQKLEDEVPSTEVSAAPASKTDPTTDVDDDDDDNDDEESYEGGDKTDKRNKKKHATDHFNARTDVNDKVYDGIKIKGRFGQDDSNETGGTKSILTKNKGKASETNAKANEMDETNVVNDYGDIKRKYDQENDSNETEGKHNDTEDKPGKTKDKGIITNDKYNKMDDPNDDHIKANYADIIGKDNQGDDIHKTHSEQNENGDKPATTNNKGGDTVEDNSKNTSVEQDYAENVDETIEPQRGGAADDDGEEETSKTIHAKTRKTNGALLRYSLGETMPMARQTRKPKWDKHNELPTYWVSGVLYYI